jgi:hypothetical protein
MALRVQRSALVLAVIVLSGCEGGTFATGGGQGPVTSNPAISQTGTQTVRQRVQQLRSDQAALANAISQQQGQLSATRSQIAGETQAYAGLVNTITSRLQSGTTPGDPELVNQWNSAQAKLDGVTMGVGTLNSLATQVTTQASVAGYLLENVRATYAVGGAVEEDHRNLRSIESETTSSMQQIDRLIGDLNAEIARQNGFLGRERTNLAALSYGVNLGRLGAPSQQRVTVTPRRVAVQPTLGMPVQLGDVRQ